MIDNAHHGQRRFAVELVRIVLKNNPHLLMVNHFLTSKERLDSTDTDFPVIHLVYGRKQREHPLLKLSVPTSGDVITNREL